MEGNISLTGVVKHIYNKEGIAGFYKGYTANIWRVAGWNAINFTIYSILEGKLREYKS